MTRTPGRTVAAVETPSRLQAEWGSSGLFAGVAIAGSLAYAASLGLVMPRWRASGSALWLLLSAGLAWCALGPALVVATGGRVRVCVQACLATMAYGEAVLVAGACVNAGWWLMRRTRHALTPATSVRSTPRPAALNAGCVALSNVAMAGALAARLRPLGVPRRRTLLLWTAVLDGTGALLAWAFRGLLKNGT